jgi:hypothetical protein
VFCDELGYFLFEEEFSSTSLLLEDRETSLIVGFTDVHDDTPFESALETRFELSEFFRRTIPREDDLLPCFVEDIEDIIEFLLCRLFPGEKLDIIDDEHINATVAITEFIDTPTLDTRDIVREEPICGSVDYLFFFMPFAESISYPLQNMSFPESYIPIDIEWVV